MPSSPWSPTGVLTIVSLVSLCLLSFVVVLGSDNIVNTQVRDTVYLFPKRDTPHHPRVFHHGRAPIPQASAPPASNDQPDAPAPTPTPVEPSSPPKQTPSSPNTQTPKQPPPAPSPSPSPPPPRPQSERPAQSSSPPSAPSSATPSSSATPADTPSTSSPTSGPTTTSNAPASLSQGVSSSQIETVSNIGNYSATAYSYSYQPGSIKGLGGSSTNVLPNTAGSTSTVSAESTAGATSKGFFANKAGVGVTFGIVGIVGALALLLGVRMILKRYRNSRESREVDEWFEKYSTGHGSSSWHGDGQYATDRDDGQFAGSSNRDDGQYAGSSHYDDSQSGGSRYGAGASASDVAATAAMIPAASGAYPDRSVHYGQQNSGSGSGGVVLPPSVNFVSAGGASHSRKLSHSSSLRYSVTASQAQAGHPYAASTNPAYAAAAPPLPPMPHVPYPPAAHGQEQANFAANGDPFYRPNATGASVAHTGYAQ